MCVYQFQSYSDKAREIGALGRQITRTMVTMLLEKYVLFEYKDRQYSIILDIYLFKLEQLRTFQYFSLL